MDADEHPRSGWGTGAVAAIKAGASKESLKRMTLIVLIGGLESCVGHSAAVCPPFWATERFIMNTNATSGIESTANTKKVSK